MVNIPWTIYREHINTQYTDQWEFVLYDSAESMASYDPSTMGNRILSYDNNGIISLISGNLSIPQSRITKLSFPTPFANFNTKDLPNKMNVYNEATFDTRDVTVSFTEDTAFTGYKYFEKWYNEVYNNSRRQFVHSAETKYRYASVIFKTRGLSTNSASLIDVPTMRFDLYRLKLVKLDDQLDLDYSSGKPLEFTAVMKVEDVKAKSYIKARGER